MLRGEAGEVVTDGTGRGCISEKGSGVDSPWVALKL